MKSSNIYKEDLEKLRKENRDEERSYAFQKYGSAGVEGYELALDAVLPIIEKAMATRDEEWRKAISFLINNSEGSQEWFDALRACKAIELPLPQENPNKKCCMDCQHAHLDDSGLVEGYSCMRPDCNCHPHK